MTYTPYWFGSSWDVGSGVTEHRARKRHRSQLLLYYSCVYRGDAASDRGINQCHDACSWRYFRFCLNMDAVRFTGNWQVYR